MNPNIQVKTVQVPASGTVRVDVTGSTVLFTSSTGTFNFALDGGMFQPGFAILGIDVSRDISLPGSVTKTNSPLSQFKNLLFQDTSGAVNTITYIVANYPVSYANPVPTIFQKNAPTYSKGTDPIVTMAGGATQNFTGLDGTNIRKQFVVTNNDAALVIQVLGANGKVIGTVYPQRPWTVETNGLLTVKNPNGGALTGTVNVGEIFYS